MKVFQAFVGISNWDFGLGDRNETGTLLNIQPVVPSA